MVAERPEASTARPDAALASGGAVVMVSGANFVNFVDFGGATSGAPGICAFGSGGRVAVDVGDGAWVSSALVRCEAPPTADASAGGSRAELEPVTISTSSKIFADGGSPLAPPATLGAGTDTREPDGESSDAYADDDRSSAFIARVRAAPSVRAVRPGTVNEHGGDAVVFALGASLPSTSGGELPAGGRACSCQFGSIVRVAASSCWGGEARCVAPAMRPARGVATRFCSHEPASLACSGNSRTFADGSRFDDRFGSVTLLDVAAGWSGSAESAVPSTAASVGPGSVAVGVRVSLHGWGLRRDSVRSGAGLEASSASASALGVAHPTLCAVATAPTLVAPVPASTTTSSDDRGRVDCVFRSLPPSGFHVVTLHSSFSAKSDETFGNPGGNFGGGSRFDDRVGGGVQMLVRAAPRLRAAYPSRSPATGGGILYVSGGDMHGDCVIR